MNIEFTQQEREMLSQFAKKQHEGAKDNIGTMTPIHIVERIRKEFVEDGSGQVWLGGEGVDWQVFENFDELLDAYRSNGNKLPEYEEVKWEEINDIWIEDEKSYCEAYGIEAYSGRNVEYTEPVAFFFIRDEAVRYKDDYQAHNCEDCRIYTYGLGYSNKGDLPVFRALLMRLGEELNKELEEANYETESI